MTFPFRRPDARREELDQMRRRIAELQKELTVLESTNDEGDAASSSAPGLPVPQGDDIYTSVSRLRVTMVQRELRTKTQQLDELIEREKALARELHVRPAKPASPQATSVATATAPPVGAEGSKESAVSSPSPVPPPQAQTRPAQRGASPVGGVRVGPQRKRSWLPKHELKFRAASVNLFAFIMSIVALVAVFVLGIVLSGLLEIDPNRPYGVLSDIARALQGVAVGILPR